MSLRSRFVEILTLNEKSPPASLSLFFQHLLSLGLWFSNSDRQNERSATVSVTIIYFQHLVSLGLHFPTHGKVKIKNKLTTPSLQFFNQSPPNIQFFKLIYTKYSIL